MGTGTTARIALIVLGATCCAACTWGTAGELGECRFEYYCSDESDLTCDASYGWRGRNPVIPPLVAVEATFTLLACGDDWPGEVVPASSLHVISIGADDFRMLDSGPHAFLAREDNGRVRDFAYLHAADVASLGVWRGAKEVSSLEIAVDTEVTVSIRPVAADASDLSGAFAYAWTTTDPLRASVTGVEGDNTATIRGEATGEAEIEVSNGVLTTSLSVTVVPP